MKKLSLLIIGIFLGIILAFTIPIASAHNEDLLLVKIKQLEGKISELTTKIDYKANVSKVNDLHSILNQKVDDFTLALEANSSAITELNDTLKKEIDAIKTKTNNITLASGGQLKITALIVESLYPKNLLYQEQLDKTNPNYLNYINIASNIRLDAHEFQFQTSRIKESSGKLSIMKNNGESDENFFIQVSNLETKSIKSSVDALKIDSKINLGDHEIIGKLKEKITALINTLTQKADAKETSPIGTVVAFAGDWQNIPENWLQCDGTQYAISDYQELYKAIGNAHGSKEGFFNVPDYRGFFLRGVSHGIRQNNVKGLLFGDPDAENRIAPSSNTNSGNDGDKVGSIQEDAFQDHSHYIDSYGGKVPEEPGERKIYDQRYTYPGRPCFDHPTFADLNGATGEAKPFIHAKWPSTIKTHKNETRPKNAYVNWIIRAK